MIKMILFSPSEPNKTAIHTFISFISSIFFQKSSSSSIVPNLSLFSQSTVSYIVWPLNFYNDEYDIKYNKIQ